ncbi:MAG TPA: DUF4942 domain-containing protein [Sphingomicrobium sp.]|nr:DUF4942 domain-containing protein [Sphingomicrobium sp.]
MTQQNLIRKATIEELVGHRARALELYAAAIDLIGKANEAEAKASPAYHYGPRFTLKADSSRSYDTATLKEIERAIDTRMWRSVMQTTNLLSLMDAKERKAFEEQVAKEPPPCTVENICATCGRLMSEADAIFRRGVVNAFGRLCRDYKSNDGFKIGTRIVVEYAFNTSSYQGRTFLYGLRKDDEIGDIDRAVHVLDGKPYDRAVAGALIAAIQASKGGSGSACETPYWRARWFSKGTLHLYLKDKDLLARLNKIVAEHYGETLAGPKAA